MNKQRFIEYLRKPADINSQTLEDLEDIVTDYPYFQSARTLLAKASKIKKTKQARKNIGSAAIYATDRALLKRYLNDELIFLSPISVHESHEADYDRDRSAEIKEKKSASIRSKIKSNPRVDLKPPTRSTVSNVEVKGGTTDKPKETEGEKKKAPGEKKASPTQKTKPQKPRPTERRQPPQKPTPTRDKEPSEPLEDGPSAADQSNSLDNLIDELYRDMEALKVNREKFMEYERKFEEEEAVDEALKKASEKKSTPPKREEKEEQQKPEEEKQPEQSEEKAVAKKEEKEEEKKKTKTEDTPKAETADTKEKPKTETKEETKEDKKSEEKAEYKEAEGSEKGDDLPPANKDDAPRKASESRSARGNRKKTEPAQASTSGTKKATSSSKSTTSKKTTPSKKKTTSSTSKSTGKKTESKKSTTKSTKKEDKSDDKSDPRKVDQNAIISNFIKKNPSISPADSSSTKSDVDLSNESTAFHPEVASEYLAEIYLKQGKKERATEIYKALMLKFPEKKSYFAGLIEKLK